MLATLETSTEDVSDDHRTVLAHVRLKAASEQTTLTDACRDKTPEPDARMPGIEHERGKTTQAAPLG